MRLLCVVLLTGLLASCGEDGSSSASADDGKTTVGAEGRIVFNVRGKAPPQQGSNGFHAMLQTVEGETPLESASISVDVIMPVHGHASATQPVVHDLGGGQYEVDDVVFTMSGTWDVAWHVSRDGVHDHQTFTYDIE